MSGSGLARVGLQVLGGLIGAATPLGPAGGILIGGPVGAWLLPEEDVEGAKEIRAGDGSDEHVDS